MKTLITLLIITTQQLLAIVSIAPVEIGEKAGFHGSIAASLTTQRGSTEQDNYNAGMKVIYDSNSSFVTWAEISGEYGESNDVENTNKVYSHVRYIHALTKEIIRVEFLGQVQKDKFKLINQRTLGGAGLRFKAFELFESSKGYLGVGGFYENITYTSNDETESNIRANNYFTYTTGLSDTASLSYTFYYQPLFEDFDDYIQSHMFQLKLQVYQELYLSFKLSYNEDSRPPLGINEEDFYQETSLNFSF